MSKEHAFFARMKLRASVQGLPAWEGSPPGTLITGTGGGEALGAILAPPGLDEETAYEVYGLDVDGREEFNPDPAAESLVEGPEWLWQWQNLLPESWELRGAFFLEVGGWAHDFYTLWPGDGRAYYIECLDRESGGPPAPIAVIEPGGAVEAHCAFARSLFAFHEAWGVQIPDLPSSSISVADKDLIPSIREGLREWVRSGGMEGRWIPAHLEGLSGSALEDAFAERVC